MFARAFFRVAHRQGPISVRLVPRALPRAFSTLDLDNSLIVTKACAQRIKKLRAQKGDDNLNLRVQVDSGGCSGFQYVFEMDSEKDEEDVVFARDGAAVVVDPASLQFIKGATIDFEQELIRSAFAIVNNPQSESACGCGSSFAVKNFDTFSAAH